MLLKINIFLKKKNKLKKNINKKANKRILIIIL